MSKSARRARIARKREKYANAADVETLRTALDVPKAAPTKQEASRSPVPRLLERQPDPAASVPGMPPNFGQELIPHVITFQGVLSSLARVYRPSDEAIKHSYENARFMRNDPTIMECIEQRKRSVALLDWHLEPDDESDPVQQQLCEDLTLIISNIPYFMKYRECLLEAIWTGKSAVHHCLQWLWIKDKKGKKRKLLGIPKDGWWPVHGDKLVFRYNDGSGEYSSNQVGIRVGAGLNLSDPVAKQWDPSRIQRIMPTDYGLAYFLTDAERDLLSIHKHMIEDGEYEDPQSAGKIHGVGIRSRIYWCWYQKQELLAWLMEYIERSAFGIEIWYYPWGNDQAREETRKAAEERIGQGRNVVLVPRPMGEEAMSFGVERIEVGMAGVEACERILSAYFGHLIKRYILGQTLTTESEGAGLGSSGIASVHLDTYLQIVRYDSTNLEETLTTDLVDVLKRFNFPRLQDVPVKFKIDTESPDVEGKLAAWKQAYEMGARLRESEVFDLIGTSAPEDGDVVLQDPQHKQAQLQMDQMAAQTGQIQAQTDHTAAQADDTRTQSQLAKRQQDLQERQQAHERDVLRLSQELGVPMEMMNGENGQSISGNGQATKSPEAKTPKPPEQFGAGPGGQELLPGGRADGMVPSQFDSEALKAGIRAEMEHTADPAIAAEIAMDHLSEDPAYYGQAGTTPEDSERKRVAESYQKSREELETLRQQARDATDTSASEEAKKAGNYRKGKFRLDGLEISIENPRGSVRSGKKPNGSPWSVEMPYDYGYIRKTESEADGDHIDVFLGPDLRSDVVFIVDQTTPGGHFDEHKCMIGWHNAEAAKRAYLAAYDPAWKGFESITALTMDQFKDWLEKGDSGKRAAEQVLRYAKKPAAGQKSLSFDEDSHPRAPSGSEKGGQFVEKGEGGKSAPPPPEAERPAAKGEGKPVATETPEFKRWFGESKVVDKEGKPVRVFHGGREDFTAFEQKDNQGIYFTPDAEYAGVYASLYGDDPGANVKPVYVRMTNPKVVFIKEAAYLSKEQIAQYEKDGYDGLLVAPNWDPFKADAEIPTMEDVEEVVVWKPEQIKSATGNRGTFDPKSPDVRYSRPRFTPPDQALIDEHLAGGKGSILVEDEAGDVYDFQRDKWGGVSWQRFQKAGVG